MIGLGDALPAIYEGPAHDVTRSPTTVLTPWQSGGSGAFGPVRCAYRATPRGHRVAQGMSRCRTWAVGEGCPGRSTAGGWRRLAAVGGGWRRLAVGGPWGRGEPRGWTDGTRGRLLAGCGSLPDAMERSIGPVTGAPDHSGASCSNSAACVTGGLGTSHSSSPSSRGTHWPHALESGEAHGCAWHDRTGISVPRQWGVHDLQRCLLRVRLQYAADRYRLAASVCQLRHDQMEWGPLEPRAGRSTLLLSSGGAGGRVLLSGL